MSTLLGTILSGRYRLEARIGAGGMSTVYLALDETLERRVAIKLLNREVATDSDELERFRREARAVAQLSHPHIVGVIDAGEDEGRPYIVFEYVDGETLKERIRRLGPLPIPEAVAYAIEIARALGAAHARHIVHRDVKPQNVLIDEEGSAKVTDFGIARTLDEEGLTADGRVIGTTDYVSPEQALGHPVTGQSDLYSLGIVLYEMLTGEVPFKGDSQVAVAMKHVREPLPDVQRARGEISAALASVVDRATAKQPSDRYRDDAELIADLEDALAIEAARSGNVTGEVTAVIRSLPTRTRRVVPFRLQHRAAALLLLALAAAAGIGVLAWVGSRAHRGNGPLPIKPPHRSLEQVIPCGTCAQGFNPLGSPTDEAPNANLAIDDELGTFWDTQQYYDHRLDKAGTGIYVNFGTRSPQGTTGSYLQILDATPGFTATIYARHDAPPMRWPDPGWRAVSSPTVVGKSTSIHLTSGDTRYRYFLVWITNLGGHEQLSIDEIALYTYRTSKAGG
ncbi:MAG TPA: protein kinase [Solirubrobacteraceae bacterium]|nr:protein kinase [Solirubrobacteraceae bacterium]